MDLEKIERALEHCVPIEGIPHENWCDALIEQYGSDLLRLVRAMRWMQANRNSLYKSVSGDWFISSDKPYVDCIARGQTPLAAIEAAMTSNQPRAT